MKESVWGYWIMVLGLSILSVMVLLQSYTTTSEQDYYLIKNVMEAAMYDSVDYGYYTDTSTLKINSEKFVENFVRRFAEQVNINKSYTIKFYDIYESPPYAAVSVTAIGQDGTMFVRNDGNTTEVVNRLAGILIGQVKTMQEAMDEVKMVVEGVYSAKAAIKLGEKYGISMPIVEEVNKILFDDKKVSECLLDLMRRDAKDEHAKLDW